MINISYDQSLWVQTTIHSYIQLLHTTQTMMITTFLYNVCCFFVIGWTWFQFPSSTITNTLSYGIQYTVLKRGVEEGYETIKNNLFYRDLFSSFYIIILLNLNEQEKHTTYNNTDNKTSWIYFISFHLHVIISITRSLGIHLILFDNPS